MNPKAHWLGAGLSTGSGLAQIAKNTKTYLWNRNLQNAENIVKKFNSKSQIEIKKYESLDFAKSLQTGDIVVCMLATNMHLEIAKLCLAKNAHFVSSSYMTPQIKELALQAQKKNLIIQLEAGLDPGIDHLFAHQLIQKCQEHTGKTQLRIKLESYCGGFPKIPNDFYYKFSWAPLGVLMALKNPACHIENQKQVKTNFAWEAIVPYFVMNEELESYPNRNSLIYQQQYCIPDFWQVDKFIRGTLRLKGWKNAWKSVFALLQNGTCEQVENLANELAAKYPYQNTDADRILLFVKLSAYAMNTEQKIWEQAMKLDAVKNEQDSAMARAVSQTLACAVEDIVEGKTSAGLHLATKERSAQWLQKLKNRKLEFEIIK